MNIKTLIFLVLDLFDFAAAAAAVTVCVCVVVVRVRVPVGWSHMVSKCTDTPQIVAYTGGHRDVSPRK